jgi:hypothetical protein
VRPLVPLRAIAGNAAPIVLRTLEGEDGNLVTVERDGTKHALAILEGDDFQTVIDGHAVDGNVERVRALVAELALHYPLGLGAGRVRAVRHTGPTSWREERDGMTCTWHAPAGDAAITIYPARPLAEPSHTLELALQLFDERFEHLDLERPLEHTPLMIGSLRGTLGRAIGRYDKGSQRVILTAGLCDSTYRYVARIDRDANADHDGAFFAVMKSLVAIAPTPRAMIAANAVGHWAD